MRRFLIASVLLLALAPCRCVPGPSQSIRLRPTEACVYPRGDRFLADAGVVSTVQKRYMDTLTAGGDSVRIFVRLDEYVDLIEAHVEMSNNTNTRFTVVPDMFVLLDGSRLALVPIDASVVANDLLAHISAVPAYRPKYNYTVQSSVNGTANTQYLGGGQYYTTYGGSGTSTVTAREDPYNALGYALGAYLVQAANEEVEACARRVYEEGIGNGAALSGRSRAAFTVYWRNRIDKVYPLRFLIKDANIELEFEKVTKAPPAQRRETWRTGALAD